MKNREAAFSNFLSKILINEGFKLTCQITSKKVTTKTLNLFLWKRYENPSNEVIEDTETVSVTKKLRNFLKKTFETGSNYVLDIQGLLQIPFTVQEQSMIGLNKYSNSSNNAYNISMINNLNVTNRTDNNPLQNNDNSSKSDVLHSLGF